VLIIFIVMIILRHKFVPAKMVIIAVGGVCASAPDRYRAPLLNEVYFSPAHSHHCAAAAVCTPIFQERNSTLVCSAGF
jgi:hypothetical protein